MNVLDLAYLGPAGSFSHVCALKLLRFFSLEELQACWQIPQLFQAQATAFLLPVENTLGGSVSESLDYFLQAQHTQQIRLEYVMRIEHSLLCTGQLPQIREIRAHPQALLQCQRFLQRTFPHDLQQVPYSSNSAALASLTKLTAEQQQSVACIAAKEAGLIYKIPVLQQRINDSVHNYTRFWLVSRASLPALRARLPILQPEQMLSSFACRVPRDRSGSLMQILAPIAEAGLSLTRIESRPNRGKYYEYTFFGDLISPLTKLLDLRLVLQMIKEQSSYFRFFGHYPVLPAIDGRFLPSIPAPQSRSRYG